MFPPLFLIWLSRKLILFLIFIESVSSFSSNNNESVPPPPLLPTDPEAMIKQASFAIEKAFSEGAIHRQTVRLPLSESMYCGKEESFVADRAIGWQGGPQETYRFLSPMVGDLLRQISANSDSNNSGLAPKVQEEILLDFDGSSLINAQSPLGPLDDSLALLQANVDDYYVKLISRMEEDFSDTPDKAKRLFLLINPAWRDSSSWGFFNAKRAQRDILDRYETTFALDQFIVKGNKISLFKSWPSEWCVYWTPLTQSKNNEDFDPKLLGTFPNRPAYSEVETLVVSK